MNIIKKSLIKVNYINNPKFKALSEDKKELLYEKYCLVYRNIPVFEKMFINRRYYINKGILDLVDKDMEGCLNSIFIDYLEGRIDGRSVRYVKNCLYRDFYDFSDYKRDVVPYLVFDSIDHSFYGGYPKKLLGDKNNEKIFDLVRNVRSRINYHDLKTKDENRIHFYKKILMYIVAYFVIHNEITENIDYFDKICNFFEDNFDYFYSYCNDNYEEDYNVHTYGYIPDVLIDKYNNGIVRKVIV